MKALAIAIFGCILLGLALYFHYYYKSEKEGFQQQILGNVIETDRFLNSSQQPTQYQMNGNYIFYTIQSEHLNFVKNLNNYKYVTTPFIEVALWGRGHGNMASFAGTMGGDKCRNWNERDPTDGWVTTARRFEDISLYMGDLRRYNSNYIARLIRTGDNFTNKGAKLTLMSNWSAYNTQGPSLVAIEAGVPSGKTYNRISGNFCPPRVSVHNTNRYYFKNGVQLEREDIQNTDSTVIPGAYGIVANISEFSKLRARLFNRVSINSAINEKLILNVYGNISQNQINDFTTSLKLGILFDFSDTNTIYSYFRVPYNSANLDGKTMFYSYGKFFRDVKIASARQTFNYVPDCNAIIYNDTITQLVTNTTISIPNTFDSNAIINRTFTSTIRATASAGIEDKFVGTLTPELLALLPPTARRYITSIAYNQTARIIENKLDDFTKGREAWEPSCQRGSGNYFFRDPYGRTPYERNRLVVWRDPTEIDQVSRACGGKIYLDREQTINNRTSLTDIEKISQWNFEYIGELAITHSNTLKTNFLITQASNNNFRTFLNTPSRSENKPFREYFQNPTVSNVPDTLVNDMLLNYKQNLAKLIPNYGGDLNVTDPGILNKIAQAFYEYSDGLFEITYIYEMLRVGSNMLDIRFDKKQRLPPNEFLNLRNQYNIIVIQYNTLLDQINQGTWVTQYPTYEAVQSNLSTLTQRLDPVFNPIYPVGGLGTLDTLNANLQANKTLMNRLSNQLDTQINSIQSAALASSNNISSINTQVMTDLSVLQNQYNSTIESDYRITNLINGITTGVARVFYTNSPFRVDGLALGIHAALSYNKAYNGNLDIDVGNSLGNVNFTPQIEYTRNITPPIVCSNVDFMNRVAQLYTDNIYNSMSTLSSNVFLSNAGDVKVDKIIGFRQIDTTTCGYTWQETEYDYYTNKPNVRRLVNVVLPFKFDNSVYQDPQMLIDNSLANGLQLTNLSNIPLNRRNLLSSNLSNNISQLNSLRTTFSNYLGSNLSNFNTVSNIRLFRGDFHGDFYGYINRGYNKIGNSYVKINEPFFKNIDNRLNAGINLDYFSNLDNYVTLNRLLEYVDGYYIDTSTSFVPNYVYITIGSPLLLLNTNTLNMIDNKSFYDNFIQISNNFTKLINDKQQEIRNLQSFTSINMESLNTYPFGILDNSVVSKLNNLIRVNNTLDLGISPFRAEYNSMYNTLASNIYNIFNNISQNETGYKQSNLESQSITPIINYRDKSGRRTPITYKYFYDNLNEFRNLSDELKKYNSNLVFQSRKEVPIRRILSDIENTLDNAGGACQPTYTCKSPELMRQLLDQYNTDITNNDVILRVLNAFTVSPYQCDYLVETKNRSGIAFSTTTVSKSFQVGVDFRDCSYFIATYGSNNMGYYVSENQNPPVVSDSSGTDLSGFQYIGGVLYDYYASASNTITPYVQKAKELSNRLFNALSNVRTDTYASMGMLNQIKVNDNQSYDFYGFINLLSNSTKLKYLFFSSYPYLDHRINRIIKIGIVNSNTFDCLFETQDINYVASGNTVILGASSTRASRFTITATQGYNDYNFTFISNINPNTLREQIVPLSNSPPILQMSNNYLLTNIINIENSFTDIINVDPIDKKVLQLIYNNFKRRLDPTFFTLSNITILNYRKISTNKIQYKLSAVLIRVGTAGTTQTMTTNEEYIFKRNPPFINDYIIERVNNLFGPITFTNDVSIVISGTIINTISPCTTLNFNDINLINLTGIQYLADPLSNVQSRVFTGDNSLCEYYIPTTDSAPFEKRFVIAKFYNNNTAVCDPSLYSLMPQNPTESRFGIGYQNINIQTLVDILKNYYTINMIGDRLNLSYDAKIGKVHQYYKYMNLYIFKCSVFYYRKNDSNYFMGKIPDAEIFDRYKYYTVYFMNEVENPSSTVRVERMREINFITATNVSNNIAIDSTRSIPVRSSDFSNITDTSVLTTPDQNYFIDNFLFTGYKIILTDDGVTLEDINTYLQSEIDILTDPNYLGNENLLAFLRSQNIFPQKTTVNQFAQISFYKNTEKKIDTITLDYNNVRNVDFSLNSPSKRDIFDKDILDLTDIDTFRQLDLGNIDLRCKYINEFNFDSPTSINGVSFITGRDVSKTVKNMNIILKLSSDEFPLITFNSNTFTYYNSSTGVRFPHSYFRTPIFYRNGTTYELDQPLYRPTLNECGSVLNPVASYYVSNFMNTSNLLNMITTQIQAQFRNSALNVEFSNISLSHYKILEFDILYVFKSDFRYFDYMIDTSNMYYSNRNSLFFEYYITVAENFSSCTNIPYTGPMYNTSYGSIDNSYTRTNGIITLPNTIRYLATQNLRYKVEYINDCPNPIVPTNNKILSVFTNSNMQTILNQVYSYCPISVQISNINMKYYRLYDTPTDKKMNVILEASCTDLMMYDNGYTIPLNFNRDLVQYGSNNSYKIFILTELTIDKITMNCVDYSISPTPPVFINEICPIYGFIDNNDNYVDVDLFNININYTLSNNNLSFNYNKGESINKSSFREITNTIFSSNVFYYNPTATNVLSNFNLESCYSDDILLDDMNNLFMSNYGYPINAIQYKTIKTNDLHKCIFKLTNNSNIGIVQSNRKGVSIDTNSIYVINNNNFKDPVFDTYNYIRFTPLTTRNNSNTSYHISKFYFTLDYNYTPISLSDNSFIDTVIYNGSPVGKNNIKYIRSKDYNNDLYDTVLSPITIKLKQSINTINSYSFINGSLDSSSGNDITSWKLELSKNNIFWKQIDLQSNIQYEDTRLKVVSLIINDEGNFTNTEVDNVALRELQTLIDSYKDDDGNPTSVPVIQNINLFIENTDENDTIRPYIISDSFRDFSINIFKSLIPTNSLALYSYYPDFSNNSAYYLLFNYTTSTYYAYGLQFNNVPDAITTGYLTNPFANIFLDTTTFVNKVLFFNPTTPYTLNTPTTFINSNMSNSWSSNNYPNLSNFTYYFDRYDVIPFLSNINVLNQDSNTITDVFRDYSLNIFKSLFTTNNLYLYSYYPDQSNRSIFYLTFDYNTSNYYAFGYKFNDAPNYLINQTINQENNTYNNNHIFIDKVLFFNNTSPYILNSPTSFANSNMSNSWSSNNYPNLNNFTYYYNTYNIIPFLQNTSVLDQDTNAITDVFRDYSLNIFKSLVPISNLYLYSYYPDQSNRRIFYVTLDPTTYELYAFGYQLKDAPNDLISQTINQENNTFSDNQMLINSVLFYDTTTPYILNSPTSFWNTSMSSRWSSNNYPNLTNFIYYYNTYTDVIPFLTNADVLNQDSNTITDVFRDYSINIFKSLFPALNDTTLNLYSYYPDQLNRRIFYTTLDPSTSNYYVFGYKFNDAPNYLISQYVNSDTNTFNDNRIFINSVILFNPITPYRLNSPTSFVNTNMSNSWSSNNYPNLSNFTYYYNFYIPPPGSDTGSGTGPDTGSSSSEPFTNYNPYIFYKYYIFENDKNVKPLDIQLYDKHNNILKSETIVNNGKIYIELHEKRIVYGYSFINSGVLRWRFYGSLQNKKPVLLDARSSKKQHPYNYQMPLFRLDGQIIQLEQPTTKYTNKQAILDIPTINKEVFIKYYKQLVNHSIQPNIKKKLIDKNNYYLLYDEYDLNRNLIRKDMIIGMKVKNNKVIDVIYYEDDDGNRDAFDLSKKEVKYFWNTKIRLPLVFEEF